MCDQLFLRELGNTGKDYAGMIHQVKSLYVSEIELPPAQS